MVEMDTMTTKITMQPHPLGGRSIMTEVPPGALGPEPHIEVPLTEEQQTSLGFAPIQVAPAASSAELPPAIKSMAGTIFH